jgi:hypothetical protein
MKSMRIVYLQWRGEKLSAGQGPLDEERTLLRPERKPVKRSESTSKVAVSVALVTLLLLATSSLSAGEDFYIIHSADVRGYVDPCG